MQTQPPRSQEKALSPGLAQAGSAPKLHPVPCLRAHMGKDQEQRHLSLLSSPPNLPEQAFSLPVWYDESPLSPWVFTFVEGGFMVSEAQSGVARKGVCSGPNSQEL